MSIQRKFKAQDGAANGRKVTENGSFEVRRAATSTDAMIIVDIYGPEGGWRHHLGLNWSDALMLALDIMKALPDNVTGAYQRGE